MYNLTPEYIAEKNQYKKVYSKYTLYLQYEKKYSWHKIKEFQWSINSSGLWVATPQLRKLIN